MHRYMRAIGFSHESTREMKKRLLSHVVNASDESRVVSSERGCLKVEYRKYFGERIGLIVRGTFEPGERGTEEFFIDYEVPFLKPVSISTTEKVIFDRFAEKECYAGICNDNRLNFPVIFYLQNMNDMLSQSEPVESSVMDVYHVSFAALSVEGTVLMPIEKTPEQEERQRRQKQKRENLQRRARIGDEQAVEDMTIEDMDTYSLVRKKSQVEDVYSLVDSYFMPHGIECDQYSILGEIKDVTESINRITGEEIVIMDVIANDILFDVCINRKDLVGEPEIGRRFRGEVWMQGEVAF